MQMPPHVLRHLMSHNILSTRRHFWWWHFIPLNQICWIDAEELEKIMQMSEQNTRDQLLNEISSAYLIVAVCIFDTKG